MFSLTDYGNVLIVLIVFIYKFLLLFTYVVLQYKVYFCLCFHKTTGQLLQQNRVRIRDVELLTGLGFLTRSNTLEAIQTRVFVPDVLW